MPKLIAIPARLRMRQDAAEKPPSCYLRTGPNTNSQSKGYEWQKISADAEDRRASGFGGSLAAPKSS